MWRASASLSRVARLWPGTSLWQYRMQISEGKHPPYGNSYREIIKWFTSYDDSQITKVPGCR